MESCEILSVDSSSQGARLDQFLTKHFLGKQSRTYFQYLIEEGCVLLNGKGVKKRVEVQEGDEIEVHFRLTPELSLEPENIPLDIIYEDEHLLVINKGAGLVVHPAVGHWSGTLVNALLYHCKSLGGDSNLRPGIVHRLDKDTTGVLIVAKSHEAHRGLIESFANRAIKKEYLAICLGNPPQGVISEPIGRHPIKRKEMAVVEGGREAISVVETLKFNDKISLVKVGLVTGRTHQIRVHLSFKGAPILGDSVYGSLSSNKKFNISRPLLHSLFLSLKHPISREVLEFKASIPNEMQQVIDTHF